MAIDFLSVYVGIAQKILNSHMQQQCGMLFFGLMRRAMPLITAFALVCAAPVINPHGGAAILMGLTSPKAGIVLLSGVSGLCASSSTTMVFGSACILAHVLLVQLKMCLVMLIGALFLTNRQIGDPR